MLCFALVIPNDLQILVGIGFISHRVRNFKRSVDLSEEAMNK